MARKSGRSSSHQSGKNTPTEDKRKMSKKDRQRLKDKLDAEWQNRIDEDAKWADNDKGRKKKEARKQEKEDKAADKLARKQEAKRLLEEENSSIQKQLHKPTAKNREGNIKKSRAEVEAAKAIKEQQARERAERAEREKQRLAVQDFHDFNPNHMIEEDELNATGLDAAVSVSHMISGDVTPRNEYTFTDFKQDNMNKVMKANPRFKAKQLESALSKLWEDSPRNTRNHT